MPYLDALHMKFNTKHYYWSKTKQIDLTSIEDIDKLYFDSIVNRLEKVQDKKCENQIEYRNKANLIKFCNLYINENWPEIQKTYIPILNNVSTDDWPFRNFNCNNTVFATNGRRKDYLIINFVSMGDMDTRYTFPYTSFRPTSIFKMDIPTITISEHGLKHPYWLNPPNMILGNGIADREELIDVITNLAKKKSKLKKVFVLGDCRNAAGAQSFANELDFVTHSLILNGCTHWKYEKLPYDWTDDKLVDFKVFLFVKAYWFEHILKLDKKLLEPYSYMREDLISHYWFGKYDEDWHHYKDYVGEYLPKDHIHEIDYSFGSNKHFVMPHWDNKILRKFIEQEINK